MKIFYFVRCTSKDPQKILEYNIGPFTGKDTLKYATHNIWDIITYLSDLILIALLPPSS